VLKQKSHPEEESIKCHNSNHHSDLDFWGGGKGNQSRPRGESPLNKGAMSQQIVGCIQVGKKKDRKNQMKVTQKNLWSKTSKTDSFKISSATRVGKGATTSTPTTNQIAKRKTP